MGTPAEAMLRAFVERGSADGTLDAGSRLPAERDLAALLDAPRGAVRRALDALEHEGLVTRHVGRGTFLTAATMPHGAAPTDTSPGEIMQVRLVLEPPVAALAARLANQADLADIRDRLDHGGRCDDFEGFERWDAELHHSIAKAAHNGLLLNLFDVMNTARALPVWGSLKRRTSTSERRTEYHREHVKIVEALSDRDAEAAHDDMRRHLQHVADNLLGREDRLRAGRPPAGVPSS